jgi:hypothetical protein
VHLLPSPPAVAHLGIFEFPKRLFTNRTGHQVLWSLYDQFKDLRKQTVILDFTAVQFFEGNLSALLLAIVDKLRTENGLTFKVMPIDATACQDLLLRNGLFALVSENGDDWKPDFQQSTVQARLFRLDELDQYMEYIENDLLKHRSLKGLSEETKEWLFGNFFVEAFTNVDMHSGADALTTCGQFFPTKRLLQFTFCDLGNGFWEKIHRFTTAQGCPVYTPEQAINWAVAGGSTFREKGGSALRKIRTYCGAQNCCLYIVSDGVMWQYQPGRPVYCRPMDCTVLGTTIHLIMKDL